MEYLWPTLCVVFAYANALYGDWMSATSRRRSLATPIGFFAGHVAAWVFVLQGRESGSSMLFGFFLTMTIILALQEVTARRLLTTGMHAFCRHPGLLSYGGMLASAWFHFDAPVLRAVAPIWWLVALAYTLVMDYKFMDRLYPGEYWWYRKQTPFLIPRCRRRVHAG